MRDMSMRSGVDLMRVMPLLMAALFVVGILLMWPSQGDVNWLAWINIAVMALLALLLFRYGVRLLREREEPAPGSRLRAKLVIMMVAMLLIPAMTIQMAASQMVDKGMDVWFDVRVDTLLDRALNLAQGFYERVEKDIKRNLLDYISDAVLVSAVSSGQGYASLSEYLARMMQTEGWQKVELFDINERQIAGVQRDALSSLQASQLDARARLSMRLGRVMSELLSNQGREVVVGYAPLVGPTSVIGLLRVEVVLPEGVIQNARAVEADYKRYRQLEHHRQAIRQSFTHVMLFVTLMVVLVACLVALLFARRLTAPVGELAAALRRVTEGDLEVAVPESSRDELGSLAHSFNTMVGRLRQNASAIQKAQQALGQALDSSRQRQHVLESLLANLHSGVLLVGNDGRVRLLNQAVRDILHLPEDWQPSANILQISHGNLHDIGAFYDELHHQKGDELQREFEVSLAEGRRLHLLVHGVRLSRDDIDFSGYLLVIDDISELAEAQRNRAWAEVARRLAHEIKNPLTPIKLSAERLQRRFRKQVDDAQVFDVCTKAIIDQVERLQRLIADFSTLARMPQPKMQEIAVRTLLQEMQELFYGYPQVEIVTDVDADLRCCCDPDQIRQVLINLLDNAVAASADCDQPHVALHASVQADAVQWHVEDNGSGVDAEAVEQLFEAYYSTKVDGSGLGLAIARRIAEDHGGSLQLLSARQPTHFCLTIPTAHISEEER